MGVGKTESILITHAISSTFLPRERNALDLATQLYCGGILSQSYYRAFTHIASGTWGNVPLSAFYPLVEEFRFALTVGWTRITDTDSALLSKLYTQFVSICALIPSKATPTQFPEFLHELSAAPENVVV